MFRRRRPLLRAAAVGGGAYVAGKHVARNQAARQQQDDEQNQRLDGLEQQQAPAAPDQSASAGATPSMADQLSQLATLHEQGALTDDEFAAAKARILGG